jgi:hypothetical protein
VILLVTPDPGILAYVFGISLVAGVMFGLAAALEGSRSALSSALNANRGASSVRTRRFRDTLIALQVSASVVLMIAGTMLIRGSIHFLKMHTGYEIKHVVNLDLQFPESSRYASDRNAALVRELHNHLASLPGVSAITSGRSLRLGTGEPCASIPWWH